MSQSLPSEALRHASYDMGLKIVGTAAVLASLISFALMWWSWISHLGVVGIAFGWFFGLQVACLTFVVFGVAGAGVLLVLTSILEGMLAICARFAEGGSKAPAGVLNKRSPAWRARSGRA